MKKFQLMMFAIASLNLLACGGVDPFEDVVTTEQAIELLDGPGLLSFINDQNATTRHLLDSACNLPSNAAAAIIAHRDGPDGLAGTSDDNLFETLQELDGVKYVGDAALEKLYVCAYEGGGYLFADEPGFMAFLNAPETTMQVLDVDCGIRSDSATNILANHYRRGALDPFDDVIELDAVPMVGLWTIDRLYACAGERGYL